MQRTYPKRNRKQSLKFADEQLTLMGRDVNGNKSKYHGWKDTWDKSFNGHVFIDTQNQNIITEEWDKTCGYDTNDGCVVENQDVDEEPQIFKARIATADHLPFSPGEWQGEVKPSECDSEGSFKESDDDSEEESDLDLYDDSEEESDLDYDNSEEESDLDYDDSEEESEERFDLHEKHKDRFQKIWSKL